MRYHIRIILEAFVMRLIGNDFCGQLLGFYLLRKVIEVNGRGRFLLKCDTLHPYLLGLVLDCMPVGLQFVDAALLLRLIFLKYDYLLKVHQ